MILSCGHSLLEGIPVTMSQSARRHLSDLHKHMASGLASVLSRGLQRHFNSWNYDFVILVYRPVRVALKDMSWGSLDVPWSFEMGVDVAATCLLREVLLLHGNKGNLPETLKF